MKTKVLWLSALSLLAGAGGAFAGPAAAKPAPRVTVVFVQPEKFTDCKRSSWGETAPDLLADLQRYMETTGARYVPDGVHLEIKVTDVDLAGEFEPQLGPQFDEVRIVKAIYPPRITLEYRVTDAKGAVVSSGRREITDLAYQMRTAWPQDDYLRYEKDMLRTWFGAEFRGLKAG
ncbi:MAG TPA: DUF3016 domain-containing protein [Opitutaceae bacterium]|nr:DUF3016 domain-containing protein [Opitutaceae bacterium]